MKVYVDIYMAHNLGDDLFLDVLARKFPTIEFIVNYYGKEYDKQIETYENVFRPEYSLKNKILNRLNIYDYINDSKRLSKSYDAYLFLGGSIFREESYWKEEYKKRMNIVNAFNSEHKPVFVLGANFGPVKSKEFVQKYSVFFEKCSDVCFRDSYSYNLFCNNRNVRYAPDILYQLDIKSEFVKKEISISVIEPRHIEGLAEYRQQYIEFLQSMIQAYLKQGYICNLLSFCNAEGDMEICREIKKNMDLESIRIYEYSGNPKEIIKILVESELVIASRFHANIIAIIAGKKLLPLVYSEKTSNVLKDIGYNKEIVFIKELSMLDKAKINSLYMEPNKLHLIKDMKKKSEQQFEKLREYVL